MSNPQPPTMNQYGRFAMNAWQVQTPGQYAQIPNPQEFFARLGQLAQNQVIDLTLQMQGPDSPEESTLDKVGRIQAAKMAAEEIVRHDLLTPPQDQWEPLQEDSEEVSPFEELNQLRRQVQEALQEDNSSS